jgi:hypothetical protein
MTAVSVFSGRRRRETPPIAVNACAFLCPCHSITIAKNRRYPNQSWRHLRFTGTQPFNLADHVAIAVWRREDGEAQRIRRGHCALLARFSKLKEKALAQTRKSFPIIVKNC